MNPFRRQLSAAKTALYRRPKDELLRLRRWGPRAYFRIEAWKREMEEAAKTLPALESGAEDEKSVDVWFFTGEKFWYQTAFCAWTLAKHSRHRIRPIVLDDGSLKDDNKLSLQRLFPKLVVHSKESCDEAFSERFPSSAFPNLHFWRDRQLLFRKLTDIHGASGERRMFLDSDMIFFQEPVELDAWLDKDDACNIVQRDCWESYGYSRELTEKLCGHRLPEAVNIGVFSLFGLAIDWGKVDYWLGKMREAEGIRYNVTQCTAAMLMTGEPLHVLKGDDYRVWPEVPGQGEGDRVLEHYVSDSKPYYFGEAWRKAIS